MNKLYRKSVVGFLGAIALVATVGCSDFSNTPAETAEIQLTQESSVTLARTADNVWHNNFSVEVKVNISKTKGYITLGSAGVEGSGDAWTLRIENGKPVFAWRDAFTDNEWLKLETDYQISLNKDVSVQFERVDEMVTLYVDGQMVAAVDADEEKTYLNGRFSKGFDPDAIKDACPGSVEFVSYKLIEKLSVDVENVDYSKWLIAWEFNDAKNVGRDFTGNGYTGYVYGSVNSDGKYAHFDGKSGLSYGVTEELAQETFAVEVRIKPSHFTSVQNVFAIHNPYSYAAWYLRIENGIPVFTTEHAGMINGVHSLIGEKLELNEWVELRIEMYEDYMRLYQNGKMVAHKFFRFESKPCHYCSKDDQGDLYCSENYDMGVGHKAAGLNSSGEFFVGEMDYVRYGKIDEIYDVLGGWDFLDEYSRTVGNTSLNPDQVDGNFYEGFVFEDGLLKTEGKNGFYIKDIDVFKRNEFFVELKVMPTAFTNMQNLIAAEPENGPGDEWVVRLENGVLKVYLRDSDKYGTKWSHFAGKALELNKWCVINVERTPTRIRVYQNGELTIDASYVGDISQLEIEKIGVLYNVYRNEYDPQKPYVGRNVRGFKGYVDYICYYVNHK